MGEALRPDQGGVWRGCDLTDYISALKNGLRVPAMSYIKLAHNRIANCK